MARSSTFVTGEALHVDGMSEAIKELRKIDKTLPRVMSKVSREATKTIMLPEARQRWASQRIKPSLAKRAVTASGTTTGAALKLNAGNLDAAGWNVAMGVEFGSYGNFVFGNWVSGTRMKRRVFKPWRGNRFTVAPGTSTGYIVQDAIRDNLDRFSKKWQDDVWQAMDRIRREYK